MKVIKEEKRIKYGVGSFQRFISFPPRDDFGQALFAGDGAFMVKVNAFLMAVKVNVIIFVSL
jgi:hypothetical protein